MVKVLYVERKAGYGVSIEKAFRQIATHLDRKFSSEFEQAHYGNGFLNILRNLLFWRRREADVYHITGDINYISLLFPPSKSVLSIMDVRYLHKPRGLRRSLLKLLYLTLPVRRFQYITAISEFTKSEIVNATGCDPERIRVLELPLSGHFGTPSSRPFNSEKPVLLQVGTIPNKNIPRVARALRDLRCQLRIIGPISSNLIEVLKENRVDYVNLVDLSDDEIAAEYDAADVVVFCSTYEGLGLPIIEANAVGKPVITSALSPMKETAGGAACLVDPFDHESIRSGIAKVIRDEAYRGALVEAGFRNVERFKAESIARQYASLYDEVIAGNPARQFQAASDFRAGDNSVSQKSTISSNIDSNV